jgi:hypothetical protein
MARSQVRQAVAPIGDATLRNYPVRVRWWLQRTSKNPARHEEHATVLMSL